jgi:hypothetical protein
MSFTPADLEKLTALWRREQCAPDTIFFNRKDFIRWMRDVGKSDEWINERLVEAECEPISDGGQ